MSLTQRIGAIQSLRDWAGSVTAGGEPPPAFAVLRQKTLKDPQDLFGTRPVVWGTSGFRVGLKQPEDYWEREWEQLFSVIQQLDDRIVEPVSRTAALEDESWPLPASSLLDFRTRIPENGLRVLGPGGRLTLYSGLQVPRADRPAPVTLEVVVRSRASVLSSVRWLEPVEIVRVLEPLFEAQIQVSAELGYFEGSAYEPQQILRPVWFVEAETIEPREPGYGPAWRRQFVEAATSVQDYGDVASLEDWIE